MNLRVALLLSVLLAGVVIPGAPAAMAETSEREASYPPAVANITHAPPDPTRGDAVAVTLTLRADAPTPDAVSLLWCRVEPDYVCALPVLMRHDGDDAWTGTIPGAYGGERDVIKRDTVHVGYNLTLRTETEHGLERVSAPISSPWTPMSFPRDGDGHYYFLAYAEPERAPAAPLSWLLLLLLGALLRRRDGGDDG